VARELALTYADLGKFLLAAHYAEEVIRLVPNRGDGYGLAAKYYAKSGRAKEALQAVEKLLKLSRADPNGLSMAGEAYMELGRFREALDSFDKALRPNPDYYFALLAKASLLATCPDPKLRDGNQAVKLASRAYQTESLRSWQRWEPAMVLAEAHAEAGNFEEAVRFGRQALEIAGRDFGRRAEFLEKVALFEKRMAYRTKVRD
jgi:tetratricopeptide (TPR) repeat protein